jgi:predicted regulator of Ras-like GTPase activity (Roadblock/LC7/MglB family)
MGQGLALSPIEFEQVEQVLIRLCQQVEASTAFLADISGQLLCQVQTRPGADTTILAALAASNLAATAEMGRLIGEPERFRTVLHEGVNHSFHIAIVNNTFLLAVVFAPAVPVGLVRLFTKQAVLQLMNVAETFESAVGSELAQDFGQALADELERALTG